MMNRQSISKIIRDAFQPVFDDVMGHAGEMFVGRDFIVKMKLSIDQATQTIHDRMRFDGDEYYDQLIDRALQHYAVMLNDGIDRFSVSDGVPGAGEQISHIRDAVSKMSDELLVTRRIIRQRKNDESKRPVEIMEKKGGES